MNVNEYKVRSIGDASVEKVEVGTFPDGVEHWRPDGCFEDVKNNIGSKICEVNGIKFQGYNEYPYGKADLSEENTDRFAEFSGLKTYEGTVAYKSTIMWNLLRYTWRYVSCNNWRKRHGLVKIKRKTRSKRERERCCYRI